MSLLRKYFQSLPCFKLKKWQPCDSQNLHKELVMEPFGSLPSTMLYSGAYSNAFHTYPIACLLKSRNRNQGHLNVQNDGLITISSVTSFSSTSPITITPFTSVATIPTILPIFPVLTVLAIQTVLTILSRATILATLNQGTN